MANESITMEIMKDYINPILYGRIKQALKKKDEGLIEAVEKLLNIHDAIIRVIEKQRKDAQDDWKIMLGRNIILSKERDDYKRKVIQVIDDLSKQYGKHSIDAEVLKHELVNIS